MRYCYRISKGICDLLRRVLTQDLDYRDEATATVSHETEFQPHSHGACVMLKHGHVWGLPAAFDV